MYAILVKTTSLSPALNTHTFTLPTHPTHDDESHETKALGLVLKQENWTGPVPTHLKMASSCGFSPGRLDSNSGLQRHQNTFLDKLDCWIQLTGKQRQLKTHAF